MISSEGPSIECMGYKEANVCINRTLTIKDNNSDIFDVSGGKAAHVIAGVFHPSACNDQTTVGHIRPTRLGQHDFPAFFARFDLNAVLEPIHIPGQIINGGETVKFNA